MNHMQMMTSNLFINLVRLALILAFVVVVLGAYVRLSHAGLACPDWPGCYGELTVPVEKARADQLFPDRPLEAGKAWKEMIHRYTAGALGVVILVIAIIAWRRRCLEGQPVLLPCLLVLLVTGQALLGMWTVTLLLKPVIVMAHLVGGMTILSLLLWLLLCQGQTGQKGGPTGEFFPWAVAGLVILAVQIMLGSWTSANYAALVCPDFPTCRGMWWPPMDFTEGFIIWREVGVDYEGGVLGSDARTAIHMSHRIGALVTLLIIGAIVLRSLFNTDKTVAWIGWLMLVFLLAQVVLGISNVLLLLPLPVAVAHNGVAALLLLSLIALLHRSVTEKTMSGGTVG
jgi:heme a synthase